MAAANKTTATKASVAAYIDAIADDERRRDCKAIIRLMKDITGKPAVMWGPGIVGFDSYHYVYDSGREGDMCVAGFSSRKPDLTLYVVTEGAEQRKLLAKLGKHKVSKACLYVRRLADVDVAVLREIIVNSIAKIRKQYR
jgi:hypothetical protein